ncbi:MAG: protein-L-isoaspartate O-methyltransferase [Bauldia sp.]|uniref:protein-L-isoaspartate O-methyltransferase family protein n=1 Tax=Bauldia sp. TaxID=2575872 RepID=UPI001D762AFF|nr:protein-L-isoaspartate O-methyltransferase [Bauldia sp.]MCB1495834.1 protein-L-isoaspartate O-methyltransferase [Bauldia sp.]
MNRRDFMIGGAAAFAGSALLPRRGLADVPVLYDWRAMPPTTSKDIYIAWMVTNRGEDPDLLGRRYDRFEHMVGHRDLFTDRDKRAFLMTPREEFCLEKNLARAYDRDFLDIGYGVTISGPNLVGRMTSSIDVQRGDKVLEVGTGSGYQSAYLCNLTDKVWSIEIIKPLAERTRGVYDKLISRGYTEYQAVTTKNADGYYGWEEAAPFDKIIVTCGIDHIPPPLLRQLKVGGIMVIPIGPPGAQHVLKVEKKKGLLGGVRVKRSDIYRGSVVPFVPFTKLEGDEIVGTHNQ